MRYSQAWRQAAGCVVAAAVSLETALSSANSNVREPGQPSVGFVADQLALFLGLVQ